MDRKALANETLAIMKQGWYEWQGQRIEIADWQQNSIQNSRLIKPDEAAAYAWAGLKQAKFQETTPSRLWQPEEDVKDIAKSKEKNIVNYIGEEIGRDEEIDRAEDKNRDKKKVRIWVQNADTVACIHEQAPCAVLNFASAKNPGGGFLNGALAQEEALAAASGLYQTLTKHPAYYQENRSCGHMVYTNHAIYSPEVVFFRNAKGDLLPNPSRATVLTMPAVNLGQVILHKGDLTTAKRAMKERMRMILGIFAAMGDKRLILGAYGCGVFRNDPFEVAQWWKELLEEGYDERFDAILFAVYDRSKTGNCIRAFEEIFADSL